jgi:hypothetical protein
MVKTSPMGDYYNDKNALTGFPDFDQKELELNHN